MGFLDAFMKDYNLPGSYKLLFNNVEGLVNQSNGITSYTLPANGTAVFVK